MTQVDELIREALNEEDARWFDEIDEQSVPELVVESFRGRFRWYVVLVYASLLVFLICMIWAGIQLLRATDVSSQIRWGFGFMFCFATVALLKVWYWMELNRIAVTREIKRFELQLARLSHRMDDE